MDSIVIDLSHHEEQPMTKSENRTKQNKKKCGHVKCVLKYIYTDTPSYIHSNLYVHVHTCINICIQLNSTASPTPINLSVI